MPHRKIRAVRKKVEGARERADERKQQAGETKKRARTSLRRAADVVERRVAVPIENEAIQSRREAARLGQALGVGGLRQRAGTARERLAGIELGQVDGGEMGALAQIDALEQEAYGDGGVLASVDEQLLDIGGGVDVVETMDLDSVVDDLEDEF